MTSKKWSSQLVGEDEGKETNLKEKSSGEKNDPEKQLVIEEKKNCLPKKQSIIILFDTDIILCPCLNPLQTL